MDLREDESAISEIVGALMLVVIVVAASTSLGAFLLHKQDQIQEQQQAELQRSLESIVVTDLEPVVNASAGDRWLSFNFTVVSLHDRPTFLRGITVNDAPVRAYGTYRLNTTSGAHETDVVTYDEVLRIGAREQLHIKIDVASGFFAGPVFPTQEPIDIRMRTDFGNTFGKAFLPPTAIAQVTTSEQWNGTGFEPFVILDGSLSDAPADGTLVKWNWTVDAGTAHEQTVHGRKARVDFPVGGMTHTIRLEVTDRFGMTASAEVSYFY